MSKHFRCEAQGETAEIYLYGIIGSMFDGVNATDILAEIGPGTKKASHLNIHVSSFGGEAAQGVTIRSFFMNHPASKTVYIDGTTASAATIAVAMPGVKTIMARGSEYMIHNAWAQVRWAGNAADFINDIPDESVRLGNNLAQFNEQMVGIYEERTGISPETIGDMLDAETYMNPETAIELGFADEMSGQQAIAAYIPESLRGQFKTIPERYSQKRNVSFLEEPEEPTYAGPNRLLSAQIRVAKARASE